jgi:predicted TIM-barrel fold metal-dependent hydrolase
VSVVASLLVAVAVAPGARAADVPIIDAHSQVDHEVDLAKVIELMNRAGVVRTILSARGRVTTEETAAFAARHPHRITAAVRTKGWPYARNEARYYRDLQKQLAMPEFRAMAEVILWHAKKGDKAPEWIVSLKAEQAQAALKAAIGRGWPFIAHYEFAAAGEARPRLMAEFEAALTSHRGHPFVLIHMGQLPPEEARRLIATHPNLYFLVSHSNSVTVPRSQQPWINMFEGDRLAAPWKSLILQYPDRFVLNFDNVFAEHWGDFYLEQVKLWRGALKELPEEVANAVAHGNAERLWRLPPAQLTAPR